MKGLITMNKILRIIKNNILGFITGVVLCIGIGGVIAATIASTNVSYTTSNNSSVSNVKQAIDDLYSKSTVLQGYRYWNDSFSGTSYNGGSAPSTIFNSRAALEGSTNFSRYPIYIRSNVITQNISGHSVCIYYNNKEFCLSDFSYWESSDVYAFLACNTTLDLTQSKIYKDIVAKFGVTPTCSTNASCGATPAGCACSFNYISCSWKNSSNKDVIINVSKTINYISVNDSPNKTCGLRANNSGNDAYCSCNGSGC